MTALTADTLVGMANKNDSGGKRGRKPTGRTPTVTVFARVAPELAAALENYLKSLRPQPSQTAVVETALEDFLASKGFWHPPEQADE